jgi:NitT/TauT family transport system substrate-binding protein
MLLAACGGAVPASSTAPPGSPVSSDAKPAASAAAGSASTKSAASATAASGAAKPVGSAGAAGSGAAAPAGSAAVKPGSSAPAGASTRVTAAFSTLSAASTVPWVTKGAGLFDQQGLNVDLPFLSPTTLTTGLVAGSLDMGYGSPGNVAIADAQGADLVIVGTLYEGPIFYIVARPEIAGLQDLKGKKVTATQRGATSDLLLHEILKQQGYGPDDVSIVYIPNGSDQVAALSSKAVDAAVITDPSVSIAVQQGGHVIFDPNQSKSTGTVSMSVLGLKRSYLAAHRDTVKKFITASIAGVKLMKSNPAEAAKYTASYLKIDDPKVLTNSVENIAKITPDDMSFTTAGLKSILDTTATTSPEVAKLKPEDITDLSVIQDIKAGK